jgi:VWFA-related protein
VSGRDLRLLSSTGFALCLAALAVLAQETVKQERPLRHDASAIVKLVPVRVLGPDGRPIPGLRKEDFTLLEDGQRMVITEFEVHAIADKAMPVGPEPPPPAGQSIPGPEAAVRKIFFFLDQQASDEAGKAKARTAALRFLDTHVRPGDEVAVVGFYAMSGFYIREYLTTDLARIRRAINKPGEAPPRAGDMVIVAEDRADAGAATEGINVWVAGGDNLGRVGGAGDASDATPGAAAAGVFVPGTSAFQRADFVPRLEDLIEVFKAISGVKSLILFTSRDLGREAERLGRLFGAAGTTVFAVNTQDWKMSPMGGAKVHFIWEDHPLKDLAAASGGRYFADINASDAIARDLQSLTGTYYVLGYYIHERGEGRFHKLRVEVARPEARVLVQDGYADPKPFGQMSDFEKDVQLIDLAWADRPLTAFQPIEVDPLVVLERAGAQACLMAQLDVDAKSGVPPGRNEICVFLRDEAGTTALARRWEVDLTRYAGKRIFAHAIIPIRSGSHELRLVVRDLTDGAACIGRGIFKVPEAMAGDLRISSPLLLEPGKGAVYMRLPGAAADGRKAKAAAEPTLLDLYRLIPKDSRLIIGEVSPGIRKVTAVIPFETPPAPGQEPSPVALEARLFTNPGGDEFPVEVRVLEHNRAEGKPDILVAEIAFQDISPGHYDLEISIEEIGWERRATFRKTLLVR